MRFILFFLSGLFFLSPSFCQGVQNNSLSDLQVKNAIGLYNNFTDGNAPIFNGTEYLYYTFKKEGDPFFVSGAYSMGWVGYERRIYGPESLFYDIQRNQLVILNADSVSSIVMLNEFVDSFYVWGHTFISLKEDYKKNLYNSGFYDRLYNGHVRLFARRIKTMYDKIEDLTIVRIFTSQDRFYIYKDGLYYLVTNKKGVLLLFADKKHEIKKMMRKKRLKLRRETFESSLVEVIAFYDQLIH